MICLYLVTATAHVILSSSNRLRWVIHLISLVCHRLIAHINTSKLSLFVFASLCLITYIYEALYQGHHTLLDRANLCSQNNFTSLWPGLLDTIPLILWSVFAIASHQFCRFVQLHSHAANLLFYHIITVTPGKKYTFCSFDNFLLYSDSCLVLKTIHSPCMPGLS